MKDEALQQLALMSPWGQILVTGKSGTNKLHYVAYIVHELYQYPWLLGTFPFLHCLRLMTTCDACLRLMTICAPCVVKTSRFGGLT